MANSRDEDTSVSVAPEAANELSVSDLLDFLRRMHEIRLFEEEIQRLFNRNLVRGSTHLCSGQEAVAVGACAALRDGDSMLCTYRGHGAVLAMGASLDRTFGEILGKENGLCRGKGGSMHLTDVTVGAYGSFAVVGAHLPIATGIAFESKYRGSNAVCLCIFGDGTVNIGAFHEAMNLAAIWNLPVVFLCENNLYGEYSPVSRTTPIEHLSVRADAYAIPSARIDGNDVRVVFSEVRRAVERARSGKGPTFIEALTYRHKGHSRTDPATYRPKEEVERWLARDPIPALENYLIKSGVQSEVLQEVRLKASQNVAEHRDRALTWADPPREARFDDVYA